MTIRVEIKNHDAHRCLEIDHVYNDVKADGPAKIIPPGHSEEFWIHDTHDLVVREGQVATTSSSPEPQA